MIKVTRKLPENFNPEHLPFFKPLQHINLPEPGYSYFRNRVMIFSNGIVVNGLRVEHQSLLYDIRFRELGSRFYMAKKIIKSLVKNEISVLKKETDAISIINEWTNNYFHWITEALPKLVYVLQQGRTPKLLLPAHYQSEYQIRSLQILGVSVEIYSAEILIRRNIILPFRLAPFPAHYNPDIMQDMVVRLKSNLKLNKNKGNRLYISRRKANKRKIVNEDEVIKILDVFDFQILELEDHSFDDQVSFMHHAKILVSMHGAGLTNMVFCKPHSSIFELSLENQFLDKCYYTLANACNLNYYYQFCKSASGSVDYHSTDLFVDLTFLKENLIKIINRTND